MRQWGERLQAAASPPSDVPAALEWAESEATIILPTEGRLPFRAYPYQAKLLRDLSPRRIVLKARQTGLSNAIALEALHKAITRAHSTELFVSKNMQAARVLILYCQHALNGMRNPPTLLGESQSELLFTNGSRIVSLPATPSTGRSFAATDVYLDEYAFTEYADLIYESVIGTVSTGGRLTILSTPKGRTNKFFRIWSGLEGGEWSRHQIRWSDCPRYDEAWAAKTRAGMTVQAFSQEYDTDFLLSGEAVFDPADLARALLDWNPDPAGCTRILTAWDIGRRRDHSVGISLGLRPGLPSEGYHEVNGSLLPYGGTPDIWHEVGYERHLIPYPAVQTKIEERHRRMRGKTYVESNGPGDPVIENLQVAVEPHFTASRTKVQAIQALQLLLQQGRLKYGSSQLGLELSLYEWADEALIQDSVMAASIAAFYAVQPAPVPMPLMQGTVRGWSPQS